MRGLELVPFLVSRFLRVWVQEHESGRVWSGSGTFVNNYGNVRVTLFLRSPSRVGPPPSPPRLSYDCRLQNHPTCTDASTPPVPPRARPGTSPPSPSCRVHRLRTTLRPLPVPPSRRTPCGPLLTYGPILPPPRASAPPTGAVAQRIELKGSSL